MNRNPPRMTLTTAPGESTQTWSQYGQPRCGDSCAARVTSRIAVSSRTGFLTIGAVAQHLASLRVDTCEHPSDLSL